MASLKLSTGMTMKNLVDYFRQPLARQVSSLVLTEVQQHLQVIRRKEIAGCSDL